MSERWRQYALPALAAFACVAAGPQRERFEAIHGLRVVLFLSLAAALAWAAMPAWRRASWGLRLAAIFVVASALSAALSASPAYAVTPLMLSAAGLTVLWSSSHHTQEQRRDWLTALAIAAVVIAALGLIEALGWWQHALRGRAPASTMGQRNALAHFLVLASPLLWAKATAAPTARARWGWLFATALLAVVVVLTRCRAAWLAGPVTVVCFAATSRLRLAVPVWLALGAGIALALAIPSPLGWLHATPLADTASRLLDAEHGSGAGRLLEWSTALKAWQQKPLWGLGPGQWFVELGHSKGSGHFIHSDWVALLVEHGLLGALAALASAVALLGIWFRNRAQAPLDWALVASTACAAGALGVFDSVLQLPAPLLWVCLLLGVGSAKATAPVPRRPAFALALASLAALAASSWVSRLLSTAEATPFDRLELAAKLDPLDGELRLTLAEGYVSARRCDDARPHVSAAMALLPRHPKLSALASACDFTLPEARGVAPEPKMSD